MNIKKLKEEQIRFAKKVILHDTIKKISLIGGCDQAFFDDKIISVIVVLDYKSLEFIERRYFITKTTFPYIPGYLSYREVPAIVNVYKKLEHKPDVLLCDFNGILHPRFIGAASHLGVSLDIVTIGVAKSLLCGDIKKNYVYIKGRKVGYVIRSKKYSSIYISPGNKISLDTAVKIVKKIRKHKLPEPIRLAHLYANTIKHEKLL